jgi:DNA primase
MRGTSRSSLYEQARQVPMEALLEAAGAEVRTRSGWAAIRCPWHDDRTPSASFQSTDGVFVCHGCGIKGDVIDVARQTQGFTTRKEAAEWLVQTFGTTTPSSTQRGRWRDGLWIEG